MNDDNNDRPSKAAVPPPTIPGYALIREIGSGGFGTVWLASNEVTGRLGAVKLIPRRGAGARRELVSLTRLEAHARQKSPDLLPIHHVGTTDSHLFYVMDLADDVCGTAPTVDETYRPATLDSRLDADELSPQECLRFARQLLRALASLHDAAMVHRDVKPANCVFVAGELKLADFGLLTDAGPDVSRLGTERYMPPDGRMDARADVYAAGLVIYEMVTGTPADRFPVLGSQAARILASPNLRALSRLSLTACSAAPDERYADAKTMLVALDELLESASAKLKGGTLRVILVFAAIILTFDGIGILLISRGSEKVDVNFITRPWFEAEVWLDGELARTPDGAPYRTPCTIEGLPARIHVVEFRLEGQPPLGAGRVHFAETRQITASWP